MQSVFVVIDQESEFGFPLAIFNDSETCKKSIEFSCHKLPGKVEYEGSFHSFTAKTPDGKTLIVRLMPVQDCVDQI